MIEAIKSAAIGAIVSGLISGVGIFYLQCWLKDKRAESVEEAAKKQAERRREDVLKAELQRAEGRLFFWLHFAVVRGVDQANGDLEKAFAKYNEAEDALKAFEQEQLAAHQDENRGG